MKHRLYFGYYYVLSLEIGVLRYALFKQPQVGQHYLIMLMACYTYINEKVRKRLETILCILRAARHKFNVLMLILPNVNYLCMVILMEDTLAVY